VINSPFREYVLLLLQDEIQEFMVHLVEEDWRFAAATATRVMGSISNGGLEKG